MHTARNSGIGGIAFYRGEFFTNNSKGIYDTACKEFFPYPALTARMTWMGDTIAPPAPTSIIYNKGIIQWQAPQSPKSGLLYNVYGSNVYPVDITKAENLLAVNLRDTHWELNARAQKVRHYAITTIDRFGNESSALQEEKPAFELPKHIDVPKLINPVSTKKATNGKKKKKKK